MILDLMSEIVFMFHTMITHEMNVVERIKTGKNYAEVILKLPRMLRRKFCNCESSGCHSKKYKELMDKIHFKIEYNTDLYTHFESLARDIIYFVTVSAFTFGNPFTGIVWKSLISKQSLIQSVMKCIIHGLKFITVLYVNSFSSYDDQLFEVNDASDTRLAFIESRIIYLIENGILTLDEYNKHIKNSVSRSVVNPQFKRWFKSYYKGKIRDRCGDILGISKAEIKMCSNITSIWEGIKLLKISFIEFKKLLDNDTHIPQVPILVKIPTNRIRFSGMKMAYKPLNISAMIPEMKSFFRLKMDGDVTLTHGDVIEIIGNNGNGKSTFYDVMNGTIQRQKSNMEPDSDPEFSFCDYNLECLSGSEWIPCCFEQLKVYIFRQMESLDEEDFYVSDVIMNKTDLDERINEIKLSGIYKAVGIDVGNVSNEKVLKYAIESNGGHIQRHRLAKAMIDIIISDPDIVIFDEPNNHIDRTFPDMFKRILKIIHSERRIVFVTDHKNDHMSTWSANFDNGKFKFRRKNELPNLQSLIMTAKK